MSESISTAVSAEIKTPAPEGLLLSHPPGSLQTSRAATLQDELVINNQPLDQQKQFSMAILHMLEAEPIDDGYSHPAEEIIEKALKKNNTSGPLWVQAVYLENVKRSSVAGGLLRCIGRLKNDLVEPWGRNMARRGLSHPEAEVREAAIRALETWGGQESAVILKTYIDSEPVVWLKSYASQVITDFTN